MTSTGRYQTTGNIEDQYYPNTHILINQLDLTNEIEIHEAENQLLGKCIEYFTDSINKIKSFDSALICQIHYKFLSKLYPWAGQYRTVDLAKGHTRFAIPKYIPKLMNDFDRKILKDSFLLDHEIDSFIDRLAFFKCELLAIHPFREGNGRTIRLFCDLLAIKKGYRFFEYPTTAAFIKKYIDASISGVIKADYTPMKRILKDCFRK